jgi:hypothetical protein
METIRFQKIGDIPVASDGYALVASSVANDGSQLFLYVEPSGTSAVEETYKHGFGIFPRPRMNVSKRFRLIRATPAASHIIDLPELDVTFPMVDMFPNGKVLIVAPRCAWRGKDDYDLNGIFFAPSTGQSSRILLGDGISSVFIDSFARIWVAYTDEGIFGNFGWGHPGLAPVGAAGLVCFSEAGEKIWEYPNDAGGMMADCYALNVSGSQAAIFFYSDFPICTISSEFKLAYWKTSLCGCHAFAISATQALFSGQYRDPPDAAYVGVLKAGELSDTRRVRLLLPDGSSVSNGKILGRGRHLYLFDAHHAYRASLE